MLIFLMLCYEHRMILRFDLIDLLLRIIIQHTGLHDLLHDLRVQYGHSLEEFRDIFFERREGRGERFGDARMTLKPFAYADEVAYSVFTGSKVVHKSEREAPTMEFPAPPDGVTVWVASPMDWVTPLTLPPPDAVARVTGTTGVSPVAALVASSGRVAACCDRW